MNTGDFVKLLLERHFPLFCFNSGFGLLGFFIFFFFSPETGVKYFWSYVAVLVLYLGLFVFGVIYKEEKKKKR